MTNWDTNLFNLAQNIWISWEETADSTWEPSGLQSVDIVWEETAGVVWEPSGLQSIDIVGVESTLTFE